MFTLAFWKAAGERAAKTFAQALLALIGTGAVGITALPWGTDVAVAATAALASVLTSLTSLSPIVPGLPGTVVADLPAAPPAVNIFSAPASGIVPGSTVAAKVDAVLAPDVVTVDKTAEAPAVVDLPAVAPVEVPAAPAAPAEAPAAPAGIVP